MFTRIRTQFAKGAGFVRGNPQILYTIFLLVIIPLAFIISGQKFLEAARENQEMLERERIGIMQGTLAQFVGASVDDPEELGRKLRTIAGTDSSIEELKVLVLENGNIRIIASIDKGEQDTLIAPEDDLRYRAAGLQPDHSLIFEEYVDGERHWRAVRAIVGARKNIEGFVFADVSMARIDRIAAKNIQGAYATLFFVLLAVFLLLLRHARIIDYAALYKRLKDADKMKDDFISMAAHELKTPLTIIRGYVGMLSPENMDDEDKEKLHRINASISQLNMLIRDILDVARIQQGRISYNTETHDPGGTIKEIVDMFTALTHKKNLYLKYEKLHTQKINADPERLRQILVNLIGNAVKYTPKGGVVVTSYDEGGRVYIRISDSGIGISAEDQRNLFKRFYRVKTRETEDIRGTGLGLWITRKLIDGMKGRITVESIKGKGTDMVVSFPAQK